MSNILYHENCKTVFGTSSPPCVISYAKHKGWFSHDLNEIHEDCEREFLFLGRGTFPIPLTENAVDVWISILKEAFNVR